MEEAKRGPEREPGTQGDLWLTASKKALQPVLKPQETELCHLPESALKRIPRPPQGSRIRPQPRAHLDSNLVKS